jgi:predicted nucleic acid-binding Zn ribbon protein
MSDVELRPWQEFYVGLMLAFWVYECDACGYVFSVFKELSATEVTHGQPN